MYGRRRKLSPEETAANAARREARKQAAMTCQVCDRAILANTGVVAHHGYERPGTGWQTGSCYGARALPFEVDRFQLGREIEAAKNQLEIMIEIRAKVEREEIAITRSYQHYPNGFGRKAVEASVSFTRATLDQVRTDTPEAFRYQRTDGFDEFKRAELRRRDGQITNLQAYIVRQTARFDAWNPTHRRDGDQWVKL